MNQGEDTSTGRAALAAPSVSSRRADTREGVSRSARERSFETFRMGGISFADIDGAELLELAPTWVAEIRSTGEGKHVHFVNAYTVAVADADARVAYALDPPAINLIDSTPISWIAARRGLRRRPCAAVRGPSAFVEIMKCGLDRSWSHYFLGGSEPTLEQLQLRVSDLLPALKVAGACSPPFRDLTEDDLASFVEAIRCTEADVVWVGLGTPKQDLVAARLARDLPALCVCVGAAFDFVAGTKPEAPSWIRGTGLEWLFRFVTEPRRLWRRYTLSNLRFIRALVAGRGTS